MSNKLLQAQVADKLGIRASTIKYYTQLALLPYEQEGTRGHKRYELETVKERIELIRQLRDKGLNMNGVIKHFADKGLLHGTPDLYAINLTGKS